MVTAPATPPGGGGGSGRPRPEVASGSALAGGSPRRGVAGPGPEGNLAEGVEVVVGSGMRVLEGDAAAEVDVLVDRFAEGLVGGHARRVERRHVELDEALPLLLADLQAPVHGDEV